VDSLKGAKALAIGRMAFGATIVAAPAVTSRWLGAYAERPAVQSLARMLGARDFVMGMIALHTAEHPEVGPRWQATCATVDCVDLLATLAGRSDLPKAGVVGTVLLAGGSAAAGFYFAQVLKQGEGASSAPATAV
jgi:hypothetical protein